MKPLTLCALFYGDHLWLAERCLGSLWDGLPVGCEFIKEFRLALNAVSNETGHYIRKWTRKVWEKYKIPAVLYCTDENAYKYPLMRRMFHSDPVLETEFVMWFDDDSYLETPVAKTWWSAMLAEIEQADMIGQFWLMAIQGNQWEWIKSLLWYNPSAGHPRGVNKVPHFEFCQGAWWVIRKEILRRYNWPAPDLRHNGGDSMLGELFRQQGLRMRRFHGGVRINADKHGKNSGSKRRGYSEKRVGWDYSPSKVYDLSFQEFPMTVECVGEGSRDRHVINLFEG